MTRDEFEKHTTAFLRTAGGTRPDLRVVEIAGSKTVVKDFQRSDPLFRTFIGPVLIRREFGALKKLQGVQGIPHDLQRVDRLSMAVEYVDGASLRDFKGHLPEDFFERLIEIVKSAHERGVTHCDLRNSGNVMVTRSGEPRIVDFAACIIRGRGWNPLINFLFNNFCKADLYAILMLKRKHSPDLLTPEERQILDTPLPYERVAQKIGRSIRSITRRLLTRRGK